MFLSRVTEQVFQEFQGRRIITLTLINNMKKGVGYAYERVVIVSNSIRDSPQFVMLCDCSRLGTVSGYFLIVIFWVMRELLHFIPKPFVNWKCEYTVLIIDYKKFKELLTTIVDPNAIPELIVFSQNMSRNQNIHDLNTWILKKQNS